jgi:predicted unusual protein kinase regulating ubiquinone biosynthesis (AarF/ABC1/UbiB family)
MIYKRICDAGDYLEEAASQMRYRENILNDPMLRKHTSVPEVFPELSSTRVLTSRYVDMI